MESYTLKNVRIIDPSQKMDQVGDIRLEEGKIAAVGAGLPEAGQVIDCQGLAAAPGLVDMHVHLRDPGQTHKEDLFSACRAAAAGGVTSLLAMPNTSPAMDSPELVADLLARARAADAAVYTSACVTKGLNGQVCGDFAALREAGAIALSDDGRPVGDPRCLLAGLKAAQELGMTFAAHCEVPELAQGGLIFRTHGEVHLPAAGGKGHPGGSGGLRRGQGNRRRGQYRGPGTHLPREHPGRGGPDSGRQGPGCAGHGGDLPPLPAADRFGPGEHGRGLPDEPAPGQRGGQAGPDRGPG